LAPLVARSAGPTTRPLVRDLAIERRPEPVLLLPSLRRAEEGPRRAASADPSLAVVSLVVRRAEPGAPVPGAISTALR